MWIDWPSIIYNYKHIEDDSDSVMWGRLAQPLKVNYYSSILTCILPSRVQKTQYVLSQRSWEVVRYPNSTVSLQQKLFLRPNQSDHLQIPTSLQLPPPLPHSLLCDSHRKMQKFGKVHSMTWCFGQERFIQVILVKYMITRTSTKDSISF